MNLKIIDAHAHIAKFINGIGSQGELYPIGNGEVVYASGHKFRIIPEGLGDYGFTPEKALEVMDKHNVEKTVLLQGNYLGFQNLYTYEAVKKYPNRFVGAATYDPFSRNKHKIIKHLFDELDFKIIKMEVSNGSGLMCNHDTVDLNGHLMHEVYQMANERNLIFVLDIGRPRNDCWQPDNLLKAIKQYPNMKFVICHLFACQIDDEQLLIDTLKQFNLPNVYFDLASVDNNTKPETYPYPTAQKYIRHAVDILGSHKLMWGSDMPAGICKETYENKINYILESNLFTTEELENIFYNTANNLFFK